MPPGEQVPRDSAQQGGQNHVERQSNVHQTMGYGHGDALVGERADEVHGGTHKDGHARGQRARVHRGGNGVGSVVEAIDELEDDGGHQHADKQS